MQRPRRPAARMSTRSKPPPSKPVTKKVQKTPAERKATPVFTPSGSEDDEAERTQRANPGNPLMLRAAFTPEQDPSPEERIPANVTQPIFAFVHENLAAAWRVNINHPICFVFDAVSPARQFQRGVLFNEDAAFPELCDASPGDVTETDGPGPAALMPYMPEEYKCVTKIFHVTHFSDNQRLTSCTGGNTISSAQSEPPNF